jgi:predicted ester cyclase
MSLQHLLDRHYREVTTNDYSDAGDIFSADVVTEPPGSGPITGIEAFVAYGQGFHQAFPDGHIHGDRHVESGDIVVVEGRFTGTNTGPVDTPAGQIPATERPMVLPSPTCSESPTGRSSSTASTSTRWACWPSSECCLTPEPDCTWGAHQRVLLKG